MRFILVVPCVLVLTLDVVAARRLDQTTPGSQTKQTSCVDEQVLPLFRMAR